jgi:hypothetical protein
MTARYGVVVVALALLLVACGQQGRPGDASGRLEENGVIVTVHLRDGSGGGREIAATFTPVEAGFHLYSTDLPSSGVNGLGIATRLGVSGDLRSGGRPSTDLPARMLRLEGLDVDLPVYPDGAVTITLTVEQTGSKQADAVVTYGACSEQRCLMPVRDRRIPLLFPDR